MNIAVWVASGFLALINAVVMVGAFFVAVARFNTL